MKLLIFAICLMLPGSLLAGDDFPIIQNQISSQQSEIEKQRDEIEALKRRVNGEKEAAPTPQKAGGIPSTQNDSNRFRLPSEKKSGRDFLSGEKIAQQGSVRSQQEAEAQSVAAVATQPKAEQQQEAQKQAVVTAQPIQSLAELTTAVNASKQIALRVYPDLADQNSAIYKKFSEIIDRLEAQKNPIIFQPDGFFKIAQMAANELGIAPKP